VKWSESVMYIAAGFALGFCVLFLRIAVVTGSSMEPALTWGDVCLVLRGEEVRAGDVVLFHRPGDQQVVHRAVSVKNDNSVITKGDANASKDVDPIPRDAVVGPVVLVLPIGTALEGWIHATMGATLLNQSECLPTSGNR